MHLNMNAMTIGVPAIIIAVFTECVNNIFKRNAR